MNLSPLCQTPEAFSKLHPVYRSLIEELAVLADEATLRNSFTPFNCKHAIWKVMAKHKIQVPGELFENMEEDHSLEMWAVDRRTEVPSLRFVLAIGTIMSYCSYTLDELATMPWSELFRRDEESAMRILNASQKAIESGTTQYGVVDWHDVFEAKSPKKKSCQVTITQISPYRTPEGEFGGIALVKFR